MIFYCLALALGLFVLALDQFTKYYISSNFALGEGTDFIKGFIDIYYIHNRGAAWGIFSGRTWLLITFTVIVMAVCIVLLVKLSRGSKLMLMSMSLVLSGGIGNLIDRVFRDGNVIDFLHFEFWPDFPVFNVADCAVVLGAGLLILYFCLEMVKEFREKKEKQRENGDN